MGGDGGAHSSRGPDVLDKQNPLCLDHEEVDQLVDIANRGIKRFARDCEVSAGAELRSQSVVKNQLANRFSCNSGRQRHVGESETPANDVEVPSGKDERDDRGKGNTRGP